MSAATSLASLLRGSCLSAGACARALLPCASSTSLATFWLTRMSQCLPRRYYSGEAVGLGGSGAGEITKEKGRRTRHKVGCGARAQALASMNDHGDSKRGGRGMGRRARVQAPALRREPRRREASEVACTGNIQREEEDRHCDGCLAHLVTLIFTCTVLAASISDIPTALNDSAPRLHKVRVGL